MSYAPFETRVLPILFYYLFLSIFGIFMSIKMLKKWKDRKEVPPLHLSLVFIFFASAIIVLTIGLTEAAITGFYKEIYRFSLPLAYSLVAIGNIFLFIFASNITNRGQKAIVPFIIIGIILIIVLFLPWNWWGVPQADYKGKLSVRLYTNIFFIAFSYVVYFYISLIAWKTKKKSNDNIARMGLTLFFCSMQMMVCFFLMVLADNIMIVFYNHPGYSVFQYIAWIFATMFLILSYMSLVMPGWLVKWIEKNN